MNDFRIDLPLPAGATLVEASAGTGKTWSIARLVARLIAEDPPDGGSPPTIDRVLVVTFTEAATAELRDRIRAVLTEAADALDHVRHQGNAARRPGDDAYAVLAGRTGATTIGCWQPAEAEVLATRSDRLRRAVGDFDRAPVSTIHGFCQRVLASLAFEADAPFDSDLLQDTDSLIEEIVDDWFVTHVVPMGPGTFAWFRDVAGMSRNRLRAIARARVGHRGATFLPEGNDDWRARIDAHAADARELAARCDGNEGDELLGTVREWTSRGWLNRTTYAPAKLDRRWTDMRGWLADGGLRPRPNGADLFFVTRANAARVNATRLEGRTFENALAADLERRCGDPPRADALLRSFATDVDRTWQARLASRNRVTFDDMLERVARGLHRHELVEALRQRYRVALIDEFQDTDAVQWSVFRTVFLEDPSARLLLIGDPKQAIYGFRGADVGVYTAACHAVPEHRRFTMRRNFRSDRPLIAAMNAVYGTRPDAFLTSDIRYDAVHSEHPPRLYDASAAVRPFVIRWFDRMRLGLAEASSADEVASVASLAVPNDEASETLARVVARDIRHDLAQGWSIRERSGVRSVHAGDFAVLTVTNADAARVRDALILEGVPATIARSGSVFESDECTWLQRWLGVLVAEGKDAPARALAVTPLFGFTARQLAEMRLAEDAAAGARWLRFQDDLAHQARLLSVHGVTAAFNTLLHTGTAPDGRSPLERLTASHAGERHLTNLRHLVELLDAASRANRLGPVALGRWLAERAARADAPEGAEFRLDADGAAVKVVTMHASKGLEYPIVYVPGLADGRIFRGPRHSVAHQPVRFHDPSGVLTVDLRGLEAGHGLAARRTSMEEGQRLLYVALTRAVHRLVVYAGPTRGSPPTAGLPPQDYAQSPFAVLFHGSTPDDGRRVREAHPDELLAELRTIASSEVSVEEVRPVTERGHATLPGALPPEDGTRAFTREGLDTHWRRESYSGIVGRHQATVVVSALPEDTGGMDDDEEEPSAELDEREEEVVADPRAAERDPEVPLGAFHRGPEAGKWIHDVLERVSFPTGAPKAGGPLVDLVRSRGVRRGFLDARQDPLLIEALPRWLDTPLGGRLGGLRLRDVPDRDRLDELKFDMAIAGATGEHVAGAALFRALGADRTEDPMPPGYLQQVRGMDMRALAGFLTGAIDLVFRAEIDGRPRWFVVDYKSNTLGRRDHRGRVCPTADDYAQDPMRLEVARKHYYLQYLLYLTALHRYLASRLGEDYDYDRDVGGAVYLFVRGMLGTDTRRVGGLTHGVFQDKPPRAIIEGISRALEGVRPCP